MNPADIQLILTIATAMGQLVTTAIQAYHTLTPDQQAQLDADIAAQLEAAKARLDVAITAKGG